MKKILQAFNRIDPRVLSFLIPCLFFLGFSLFYNEEQYFGYAKAYADPSWIKDSFLYSDFPGTRVFFQWIFGFLLRFLSFEQMAFWGRLFSFLLLAFPMAALAKHVKLNNVLLSFWLILLFLPQQNFFGGEWIYGGFESKSFSYVFVLWSLVFILRDKIFPAILFAAVSVYWHMLVGGWFSVYLFLFLVPKMARDRKIIAYWLVFGAIQVPFLLYIYNGLIRGSQGVIEGVNISWVYANIRNPNHIGLFKSPEYFLNYHSAKIAAAVLALVIAGTIYRRILPAYLRPVNTFLIIVLCQNLLFVLVAYFDQNGIIMKTYPFRGSAIAMLIFQLETIVVFRKNVIPSIIRSSTRMPGIANPAKIYRNQLVMILIIVMFAAILKANHRVRKYTGNKANWEYSDRLAEGLMKNSEPSETFLLLCRETPFMLSIPRKAGRDSYHYSHFIPTSDRGIYEWYRRSLVRSGIDHDPGTLKELAPRIGVSFLVSCRELDYDFLEQTGNYGPYFLYRIR